MVSYICKKNVLGDDENGDEEERDFYVYDET
jgi:hypothetical protein